MGIVEDNENPIQLEVTEKPKPKRVYTEEQKKALCDRLAIAREMKKKKREESQGISKVEGSFDPINDIAEPKQNTKTSLEKKIDKVKRIQKTIVSKPVTTSRRSLPKETKVSMDAQKRNQEIEEARKLEFESKVAQQVAIEIKKLKQHEALLKKQEEEEKRIQDEEQKRIQEEYAKQQMENNEPEEEEYEEEEGVYEEEEGEHEEEEGEYEYEEEEMPQYTEEQTEPTPPPSPIPPPPAPVMKRQKEVQFNYPKPQVVSKPVPIPPTSRVKQPVYANPLASIYQRKNPRREYNDPFLNKLFNQ